jgi:dynein heavy chain
MARKMDGMQPSAGQTKNQGDFQLAKMLEKMDSGKGANAGPVYEQLGFKHNMKFGARSELRDACKKFLRFAFLLDFVALESLSNVYLLSMQDCQAKLKSQVGQRIAYDLAGKADQHEGRMSTASAGAGKQDKAADADAGGGFGGPASEIPLFVASCEFYQYEPDESDFVEELVDPFVLPPLGRSTKEDFNPMVHLELEDEKAEGEAEESNKGYQDMEEPDSDDQKLALRRAAGLSKKWLDITPNKKELSVLLNDAF